MLALTGTTGKLGGAVLDAILSHDLIPAQQLAVLTSSPLDAPKIASLSDKGIITRRADYSDKASVEQALQDCTAFFLVSTPEIHLDFNDAPPGWGRESRHITAIDAAIAAGVKRIVYTSLAFHDGSLAGVMRAHFRTEAYLAEQTRLGRLQSYTVLREGLYCESWPLYLGHFKVQGEKRREVVVAGDGPVSWTAIADLGYATALILAAPEAEYHNKTVFLAQNETLSLAHVAAMAGCTVKIVAPEEYVAHYRNEHGMDTAFLEWWVSTYPSVEQEKCAVEDKTLERLLDSQGSKIVSLETVLSDMLRREN